MNACGDRNPGGAAGAGGSMNGGQAAREASGGRGVIVPSARGDGACGSLETAAASLVVRDRRGEVAAGLPSKRGLVAPILPASRRWSVAAIACLFTFMVMDAVAGEAVIDLFKNNATVTIDVETVEEDPNNMAAVTTTSSLSTAIGGFQDLFVLYDFYSFGPASPTLKSEGNGTLSYSQGAGSGGFAMIEWDGTAGVNYTIDEGFYTLELDAPDMGLNADLVTGCASPAALRVAVRPDTGDDFILRMELYTSANAWSYQEQTIASSTSVQTVAFELATGIGKFQQGGTSNVTFTSVKAIRLLLLPEGDLFSNPYDATIGLSVNLQSPLTGCDQDWGDAPDSYDTSRNEGGPSHVPTANLYLGSVAPDLEVDGLPGVDADGDDDNQTLNDEDAISSFTTSQTVSGGVVTNTISTSVGVTNETGSDAALIAFLDVNTNGNFATSAAERKTFTINNGTGLQSQGVSWSSTGTVGGLFGFKTDGSYTTYTRLRLCSGTASTNDCSTVGNLSTTGEVEDHALTFDFRLDWGDAPDSYGTDRTAGTVGVGPHHVVPASPLLYLGDSVSTLIDKDDNPPSNGDGTQDDNTGVDDEDGLVSVQMSAPGTGRVATITVKATNNTGGTAYLYAWLDTNRNGLFDEGERRSAELTTAGAQNKSFDWSMWSDNVSAKTYLRLRVCSVSGECSSPVGGAADGEVEDHPLTFDFSPTRAVIGDVSIDALTPDAAIATLLGGADPNHAAALLALLTALDPDAAAGLEGADSATLRAALTARLDADGDGLIALLRWETLEENGTLGFYVERLSPGGDWTRINDDLLPGLIVSAGGGDYALLDSDALAGQALQYRLVEQEAWGSQQTYGPFQLEMTPVAAITAARAKPAAARAEALTSESKPVPAWKGLSEGFMGRARAPDFTPPAERGALSANRGSASAAVGVAALAARSEPSAAGQVASPTVSTTQWIYTPGQGLYRLTASELAALTGQSVEQIRAALRGGLDLKLTNGGVAAPWVYDGEADALLFSAREYRTLFTEEDAFRLRVTSGKARTMRKATGSGPKAGQPGGAVMQTARLEEDVYYKPDLLHGAIDADYWFQDYLYPNQSGRDRLAIPLDLPGLAPAGGSARLVFHLHGASDVLDGDDHQVSVLLGAAQLGAVNWDGQAPATVVVSLDPTQLAEASSGTPLVLKSDRMNSVQWLDAVDVTYPRTLRAENDSLLLKGLVRGRYTVSGFTTGDIRVIQAPGTNVATLRENVTVVAGADGWQVTFWLGATNDVLLATDAAVATPSRIVPDEPARLKAKNRRVDYLIIAPRELAQSAEALRAWRARTFTNVEIAWLSDIEQEFGHGRPGADSIDDFLEYAAKNWRQAPEAVVLFGRGSIDHRNLMGFGNSLIPVPMVQTPWGLAPSDFAYREVGNSVRYALGRIPAVNESEGLAYVAKLQAAETAIPGDSASIAVLAADNPDDAGDFHANSNELAGLLGSRGFGTRLLYHCPAGITDSACANVRSALTQSTTWEAALMGYSGHGALRQLGASNEAFLKSADIPALANVTAPVFIAMTCSVGTNHYPQWRSLVEDLVLRQGGGSIGALAPTGLSLDADAHRLELSFVDALVTGTDLGGAARDSMNETRGEIDGFMEGIYQVTGDPAYRLP